MQILRNTSPPHHRVTVEFEGNALSFPVARVATLENFPDHATLLGQWHRGAQLNTIPHAQAHYRAATMELVAYLDEQRVEMHILTETGETVAVACAKDSIFRVQRSIERMGRECPEIATWNEGMGLVAINELFDKVSVEGESYTGFSAQRADGFDNVSQDAAPMLAGEPHLVSYPFDIADDHQGTATASGPMTTFDRSNGHGKEAHASIASHGVAMPTSPNGDYIRAEDSPLHRESFVRYYGFCAFVVVAVVSFLTLSGRM